MKRALFSLLAGLVSLSLAGCTLSLLATPTTAATAALTPSGPETMPNSPRPYPSSLTVEMAQQGIAAVVDAPPSITGLAEVQFIITKHTQLAQAAGLSFDHMAVKYAPADQRWFLVPVQSDGMITGWLQIADSSSLSGWRYGEQPTWDSRYSPSKDTYQYGLPALHDPANHFEVGFANGFPVLIEVTSSGAPQYWNDIAQKSIKVVEGAVLPTETPTATPDIEATKQAEFEAKKAEALKMVSIELNSPEDFNTLPVLDDVADFDSGKVQEAEHWLIDNVLPPADIKLPDSWRTACNDATGFCWMSYDLVTEAKVVDYRGVDAFFVMRDGKKMLRLGVEFGGPGQLIHFNLEDSKWWTDPTRIKTLIAAFNHDSKQIMPVVQFGTDDTGNTGFGPEIYDAKVYLERQGGIQFFKDWVKNRQLPADADKTVLAMWVIDIVK